MACPRGCCDDYRTHIRGVNIGSFPAPETHYENKLGKDRDAYKALRRDGLQPKSVKGAYAVQQNATTELEVTLGRPVDAETKAVFSDAGI